MPSPLHKYQEAGIEELIREKTLFYAVDMGLGKTRMVLETIKQTKVKALIFAPLRVVYSTWPAEIEKWTPELDFRIIHGKDKFSEAKGPAPDITLVNYEGLKWYYQQMYDRRVPRVKYGMTVLDESSMIKSPRSQRFKLLKGMDELLGDRRVCMSATPMPNGYHELWSQMFMLDGGEALGKTFSAFQRRWFTYTGPPRYELLLKPGADHEIMEAVKHKFFRLKAKDYLDMPELIFNTIDITLPPKVMDMYQEFKKEAIIQLDEMTQITAVSAAAASNKLRQISQGALYHEDGKTFTEIHDARIKALKALREENEGASLLVACQYKFEIIMLKKAFGDIPVIAGGCSADLAASYISQWNKGEIPLLLCHPASISHGVNLQDGGRIVVWYGIPWSLEQYIQLIGRLHRQGQRFGVVVHHIVGTPTDRRILRALGVKDQTQAGFLEAIKEAIYA